MAAAGRTGSSTVEGERLVDAREISPRVRHTVILQMFRMLGPGEGLRIVSDHDPKRLYFDFQAQHGRGFEWTYVEQGPDEWKIRIGRPLGACM